MKCVNCGTDNNLKERTANLGRCNTCYHTIAFETTSTDAKYKFTDPFFKKAITDISVNGTLSFTRKQFFYALEKRISKKNNQMDIWTVRGFLLFGFIVVFPFAFLAIIGLAIILAFLNFYLQSKSQNNKLYIRNINA